MSLTLGDLLEQEDLGLELIAGDERCLVRPVAGAHSIEIADPVPWLQEDWVMLMTGVRLRGSPREQRRLVAEVASGGMAALGFGVGVVFKDVPAAMRDEAERRSFPLFVIPLRTPFREVVGFVNRSLLSSDVYLLRRAVSIQDYLMDGLHEAHPEDAIVTRLASTLDSVVLLFGATGVLEAAGGGHGSLAAAIWSHIEASPSAQRFELDGWHVSSFPVTPKDGVRRWLAVATQRRSRPEQVTRPVIRTAQRLLELIALVRHGGAAEERAARAELLASALQGGAGDDPGWIGQRVRALGLTFEEAGRVVVFAHAGAVQPGGGSDAVSLRPRLDALLLDAGLPYLVGPRGDRLVALVQGDGPPPLEQWVWALSSDGVAVLAGAGRPVRSLSGVPESLRDAELAVDQLRRRRVQEPGALCFEGIDLGAWLVGSSAPEGLEPRVASVLGELKRHERLFETLLAYLDADLDVGRAAAALHLHQNSLRYRLRRIEAILGRSLHDLPTLANLYLAVLADATLIQGDGRAAGG